MANLQEAGTGWVTRSPQRRTHAEATAALRRRAGRGRARALSVRVRGGGLCASASSAHPWARKMIAAQSQPLNEHPQVTEAPTARVNALWCLCACLGERGGQQEGSPKMPHDLGFRGAASRALTDASSPSLQAPHGNRRATLGTAFCARHALSRVHRGGPGRHQGPRGESQAREEVRLVGRWSRARRSEAGSGPSAQGPHCCPPATHTPRPALIPGAGLDCPPLSAVGTGPSLSQRRPSAFPTLRPHVKAPPGPRAREVSPATRG